jgi:ABC-type Fe3+-citrate transport system substrate-binding protein
MDTMTESLQRMEARLEAAAALLERTVSLMEERSGEVGRIVAAVETRQSSGREAELEQKLQAAEQQIADLRAQIEKGAEARSEAQPRTEQASARKTVPTEMTQFLSRQGITTLDSIEAGALDSALNGLSLEQRLAVKAQLLRAGVVG